MSRLFILGAGASAGYENGQYGIAAPTSRTFFRSVGELLDRGVLAPRHFSHLWAFLEKYYGVRQDDLTHCDLDVEEVLTMVDVGKPTSHIRRELLSLIVLTLDKVMYGIPCPHHRQLLRTLSPDDAIITFNWDLLIDNLVAMDYNEGPNYGTTLLEPVHDAPGQVGNQRSAPLILKLHGSLNWMTCRKCHTSFVHILSGKTSAQHYDGHPISCRYCSGLTEPLMVPPTLLKNYNDPVLKATWKEARRVLRLADQLVIVGYSLPVTDFKAKWLLMEASANKEPAWRAVTIVDENPTQCLEDRYRDVLRVRAPILRSVRGGIKDVSPEE